MTLDLAATTVITPIWLKMAYKKEGTHQNPYQQQ